METGSVGISNDALLEFAGGQIGTIDGVLGFYGADARIADAGTLATSSALTGLNTVAGYLQLQNGNSVGVAGNLAITGTGRIDLDPYFLSGSSGGSSLTVGGTLTNSSSDAQALDIGYNGYRCRRHGDGRRSRQQADAGSISRGTAASFRRWPSTVRQRTTPRSISTHPATW